MGAHIADGKFQSDKYPTCPVGKVPLSVTDRTAQDLLWEYAQRRRSVDAEFSADLETALLSAGYRLSESERAEKLRQAVHLAIRESTTDKPATVDSLSYLNVAGVGAYNLLELYQALGSLAGAKDINVREGNDGEPHRFVEDIPF